MRHLVCTIILLISALGSCLAQPKLAIETVVSGFTRPVKVTHANDSRLFVAEIGGKIRVVKNGAILPTPFLDIAAKINDPDWAGIFSIAFSPNYQTSGFFYVMYVVKSKTEVQISRFTRQPGNADLADANSEVKILTIPYEDVLGGHRGGDMAFGMDGFLYISTGDNGPGSRGVLGDPANNSQNMGKLFGKLLRLDTSAPAPGDNPLGKIFALGLRNPWRFGFDRQTGDLWIGDNGQDGWEEVNYLSYPFGNTISNFGWNCLEGTQTYNASHCAQGTAYIAPKLTYPGFTNNGGKDASVMGGFVYRGSRYPSMKGYYFFGDYATGKIGYINPLGVPTPDAGLTHPSLISFGEDQSGELFVVSFLNGTLSKLSNPGDPLPVQLAFFRVAEREQSKVLEWRTLFESNFHHFVVQRSLDGQKFEGIDTVNCHGSYYTYTYLIAGPSYGNSYYRLKMVDLDGSFQYSSLIAVKTGGRMIEPFVFPNPAAAMFRVGGITKGDKISLYSVSGALVISKSAVSDQDIDFTLKGRPAGIYTIMIENKNSGFLKKLKVSKD
ncbi:PQQ-dependent sugar dehydrogenase [Dyadobacter sp. CY261]|uniref:PQQ-dependent sugar dehydrogenase n=1 Tax=Dyadobacter sp. CY261 TaxID=2907203 RepID=UPI001F4564A8|nr:PQQ-dependent sugar dehydrogenase [Dyadobacter sp. CY261]MCF0074453.1 PQQ-dependent sugar dehydrogenase [Dyadobacter sp. CY261]